MSLSTRRLHKNVGQITSNLARSLLPPRISAPVCAHDLHFDRCVYPTVVVMDGVLTYRLGFRWWIYNTFRATGEVNFQNDPYRPPTVHSPEVVGCWALFISMNVQDHGLGSISTDPVKRFRIACMMQKCQCKTFSITELSQMHSLSYCHCPLHSQTSLRRPITTTNTGNVSLSLQSKLLAIIQPCIYEWQ